MRTLDLSLKYLEPDITRKPAKFENQFRHIGSFVNEKYHTAELEKQKVYRRGGVVTDMIGLEKERKEKFQKIIEDYNIKI